MEAKQILTFSEAVKYTGFSRSTLYKLTSGNRIAHYKPGGKLIFFDRTELETWLKRNRVSENSEIEARAIQYLDK